MKTILLTGGNGFVGKNLKLWLGRLGFKILDVRKGHLDLDIKTFSEESNIDIVIHLAGANRPENDSEYFSSNIELTQNLCRALVEHNINSPIIFTSSKWAGTSTQYGESKLKAEQIIQKYSSESKIGSVILRLPNLFGKWSKPNYNSVVSTWCHKVINGAELTISSPENKIDLMYIDDVCKVIFQYLESFSRNEIKKTTLVTSFQTETIALEDLEKRIKTLHEMRKHGQTPVFTTDFDKYLYSTYVSYLKPNMYETNLIPKSDERGSFFEVLKNTNFGQISISTTKPGYVRGNHFHHTKVEKFIVLSGKGLFLYKDLNTDKIKEFILTDKSKRMIETIPGIVHAIKNTGDKDLILMMWANEIFDHDAPDTYSEEIL